KLCQDDMGQQIHLVGLRTLLPSEVRIMQISQKKGQKRDKTEHETEKSARDRKECTKAGDLIARRVKSQLQSTLGQPKSTH
ncbi:hypothetical protein Tco_0219899, partial [Tanacetum coccineum]